MAGPDVGSPVDPEFPAQPDAPEALPDDALVEPTKKRGMHPVLELLVILAVAFGLAYVVQGWVIKPYRIPTVSMVPTLKVGDMVLANRFIYHLHSPRRGDVIVFHPPGHGDIPSNGAKTEASVNYIKRIIGLPGDWVQIRKGLVSICTAKDVGCQRLNEPYVNQHPADTSSNGDYHVPQGEYFMMGDNRADSEDSRVWGFLPRRNIIGKAFVVYWPLDRLGFL